MIVRKMRFLVTGVATLSMAVVGHAFGPTVIVGNLYDTLVKEPLEVKRWADNMKALNEQIREANAIYQQTKTVADFIGDPKVSVADLRNIANISSSLARIGGSDTTFAGQATEVGKVGSDWNALYSAGSDVASSVGETMTIAGEKKARNVSLYQALAASERLAVNTRAAMTTETTREEDAQKRIDATINRVLSNPNATQTDIQTAMLSLQREQCLALSAAQRQQTMLAMQELERRAAEAKAGVAQTAMVESIGARGNSIGTQAAAAQANSQNSVRAAITSTTDIPAIDNSNIRVWLPSSQ